MFELHPLAAIVSEESQPDQRNANQLFVKVIRVDSRFDLYFDTGCRTDCN